MRSREDADREARSFFDAHWQKPDAWGFDSSPWEARRFQRLGATIADRRYPRALEIGCGAGHLTERLLPQVDALLALDVSAAAIAQAQARLQASALGGRVDLRVANVMETNLRREAPFDLVVLTETVYYLGWLYPFFNVAWLARELFEATRAGGRLLLANTRGEVGDALVRPWIVRSYHDLFENAGFAVEREEVLAGQKDGVDLEVLISLLARP